LAAIFFEDYQSFCENGYLKEAQIWVCDRKIHRNFKGRLILNLKDRIVHYKTNYWASSSPKKRLLAR